MSSPSGPALLRRVAGRGSAATGSSAVSAQERAGDLREYQPGPLWMRLLPPVVTFVVMMIGITAPSYWRDEAATMAAVKRPFGDMIQMLGNVDAVHGAYYVVAWVVVRVFGTGEMAMRMPSAIAMVIAAVFVAALGRRLASPRAGLFAGLLFAVVPDISLYGQDARSYAMVTAMATIASYVLVRALGARHGRQRRWWITYAISIALLGILNIFGLLLLAAHGATIGLRMIRPAEGQSRRALLLRWLVAGCVGLLVTSPLIALGWMQRGQLSWLTAPGYAGLFSVTKLIGPQLMSLAVLAAVVGGIVVAILRSPQRQAPEWLRTLPGLCLPWLILPPAILLIGSAITPVYNFRYILFCVPAAALLGGAGLAALGRIGGTAALVIVALLSVNSQVFFRTPGGHGDDIRQADRLIAATAKPGDVVLYTNNNAESFGAAYSYGLGKLTNIELSQRPIPSATLGGVNVSPQVLHERLGRASRLWIVQIDESAPARELLEGLHYHLIWIWHTSDIWLRLYVRKGSPQFAPTVKGIGRLDQTVTTEGSGSRRLIPPHHHHAAGFPGHSGLQH
ncbi:MAG TPA: glycosyltransferase family 39 protein [Streptosporangiaceae bacterium]|nr:glycosyltransferase family 39 protein [Streptosporangiaceae bacterium]